jgi:hypothetical protein
MNAIKPIFMTDAIGVGAEKGADPDAGCVTLTGAHIFAGCWRICNQSAQRNHKTCRDAVRSECPDDIEQVSGVVTAARIVVAEIAMAVLPLNHVGRYAGIETACGAKP